MSTPTADYPASEEDATADNLCRHLVRSALNRQGAVDDFVADHLTCGPDAAGDSRLARELSILVREFAIVQLLRTIEATTGKEHADEAARNVWHTWADGATVAELLGDWAAEYGVKEKEQAE